MAAPVPSPTSGPQGGPGPAGRPSSGRQSAAPAVTRLRLKVSSPIPVEADCLSPDRLAGLTRDQVRALPLFHGNKQKTVGDFFEVEGNGAETIEIEGDLAKVKKLGLGMSRGRLVVRGDVGLHLGAEMKGGEIEVFGDADDWAGAEMRGGLIHIHGNAGHRAGAGYRGSEVGMRHGVILIDGNAGLEIGAFMRRGLIAVGGDAGDFAGTYLIAGSIFIFGRAGARAGAGMRRGTILSLQPIEPLPTFRDAGAHHFPFLKIYLDALRGRGMRVPEGLERATFRRYVGDQNELGLGEILVREGDGEGTGVKEAARG
jgi:formylmethanofuran dehydrogenase subunit C